MKVVWSAMLFNIHTYTDEILLSMWYYSMAVELPPASFVTSAAGD